MKLLLLAFLLLLPLAAQRPPAGSTGPNLPATCFPGQLWLKTGASAGIYICNASSQWVLLTAQPDVVVQWGEIGGNITVQADLMGLLALKEPLITAGTGSQVWKGDKTWGTLTTAEVIESGNLYYTNARVRAAIGATSPLSYDATTGVMTCPGCNTSDSTTVGRGLILASGQISLDDTIANTYGSVSCPPAGVGAVGKFAFCSNNSDLYRGTGSGWVQVNSTGALAPGTAGQFRVTNDSVTADWGNITVDGNMTRAFAGSTLSLGINTATVPLKAANNVWTGKRIVVPSAVQTLAAATAIVAAQLVEVDSTADRTLTATPTIADGTAGEFMTVINTGAYSLTLQDETQLAGSNLYLSGRINFELKTKNALQLIYSSTAGGWVQVGSGFATPPGAGATWAATTSAWSANTVTWAAI